jgi:type I restriction enzyme, S subunit
MKQPATNYQKYPKYKLSGVPWLGDIPDSWEVKKLKHLTECLDGRRIPLNSEQRGEMHGEYPYWGANCIVDYLDNWLFDEELVLLGEDGAPFFESDKDVAFLVNGKIWVNNHAQILRVKKILAKLLTYILNRVDYQAFIDGSTRDKLTQSEMNSIPIQLPPIETQRVIIGFLDRKTAKINEVITKKRKLIELLKEKRQALITHAVTKGLDPNAKLKPSGIEWLGKIPEGWEVKRLKYLSNSRVSNVDKKSEDDTAVRLCNYIDVYKNEFITEDLDFMKATATAGQIKAFKLKPGDVIITKDSETPDDIGVPAFVKLQNTEKLVCGYHLAIITPNPDILNGYYLFRLLQSKYYRSYFEVHSNGVTRFGLDTYSIFNADILIPPLEEQKEIEIFLENATSKIDLSIGLIEEQIVILREYRQALITNAVTGKIKVSDLGD